MAGAYSKPFNISLFWCYTKQIMNIFILAMVKYSYHCAHKHSLFVLIEYPQNFRISLGNRNQVERKRSMRSGFKFL